MKENEISEIFSINLKKMLKANGMSNKDLAKKLDVSPSTVSMWITRNNSPRMDKIEKMCSIFGCTRTDLLEEKTIPPKKKGVIINVLGRVAAGVPIEAITDIIDTEEITEEMARTGEFFGLQIRGDSMEPKISDGDVVIVRQQDDAETGDIVIATINGDEATCKRLRKYRDGIELISK